MADETMPELRPDVTPVETPEKRASRLDREREWRLANPEKVRESNRRARAKKNYYRSKPTPWFLAKSAGEATYVSAAPCEHGHVGLRQVTNRACVACLALEKAKPSPADIEATRARGRAYHAANKMQRQAKNKLWRQKNRAYCSAKNAARTPEQRAQAAVRDAAWRNANRDRVRANNRNRLARVKGSAGTHTKADVLDILVLQKGRCAYCKVSLGKKYHVDHIMPLVRGGSNDRRNLQITCAHCNVTKHSSHPIEFAQRKGFLL